MPENPVPLITACMIVRNEAAHLPGCLESLCGLADQVVVVDTGSTDGTLELARQSGAAVRRSEWRSDFSAARNASLEGASAPWIFVIDADERVSKRDAGLIRDLARAHMPVSGPPNAAFSLLQTSVSHSGGAGMRVSIVRLFPNRPDVRYEWPIHEQVVTQLERAGVPIFPTAIEILHLGYAEPEKNTQKQQRNLAILKKHVEANPDVQPLVLFLLGGAHLDLGDFQAALEGFLAAAKRVGPAIDVGRGARIRAATCLLRLNRHAEAIAIMETMDNPGSHPEACEQMGEAMVALGNPAGARSWFERTLDFGPAPYIPACDPSAVMFRAMGGLARAWDAMGRRDIAVFVLREIHATRQSGAAFTRELLDRAYRNAGIGR